MLAYLGEGVPRLGLALLEVDARPVTVVTVTFEVPRGVKVSLHGVGATLCCFPPDRQASLCRTPADVTPSLRRADAAIPLPGLPVRS